jgi:hypothetical protein
MFTLIVSTVQLRTLLKSIQNYYLYLSIGIGDVVWSTQSKFQNYFPWATALDIWKYAGEVLMSYPIECRATPLQTPHSVFLGTRAVHLVVQVLLPVGLVEKGHSKQIRPLIVVMIRPHEAVHTSLQTVEKNLSPHFLRYCVGFTASVQFSFCKNVQI